VPGEGPRTSCSQPLFSVTVISLRPPPNRVPDKEEVVVEEEEEEEKEEEEEEEERLYLQLETRERVQEDEESEFGGRGERFNQRS